MRFVKASMAAFAINPVAYRDPFRVVAITEI
jgi:hypothetical protein